MKFYIWFNENKIFFDYIEKIIQWSIFENFDPAEKIEKIKIFKKK